MLCYVFIFVFVIVSQWDEWQDTRLHGEVGLEEEDEEKEREMEEDTHLVALAPLPKDQPYVITDVPAYLDEVGLNECCLKDL